MNIFDGIDKLIKGNKSAAILKEPVLLLKEEFAALYAQLSICKNQTTALMEEISNLKKENENIKFENCKLREKIETFHTVKFENRNLREKIESYHHSNLHEHACEHCGSTKLRSIRSRHGRIFEDLGVRNALFTCDECGNESSFMVALPG